MPLGMFCRLLGRARRRLLGIVKRHRVLSKLVGGDAYRKGLRGFHKLLSRNWCGGDGRGSVDLKLAFCGRGLRLRGRRGIGLLYHSR